MGTLALEGVRKAYGTLEVLHGIDLDVEEGEFVALVGPSGCGKSTLLRMIAGLEGVTGGEIRMDGRRVNEVEPARRGVAMVFQSYALYPHMSVRQNMAFALEMDGVPRAERTRRVEAAAEVLGLAALLDRRPKELSGGQMQRVAMGRAIVRDPALFLFDEPLSNLDAQLRGQVRAEIQALHRRLGTTTIHVTHDQVEAMTLADRVVVLRGGRIEQAGTPLDLYDRPATPFVAGFIGSPPMTLLEGTWDGAALRLPGGALPVPGFRAPEGPLTLGVRPQHLARAPGGWPATVRSMETTGHETHVVADLAAGPAVTFTLTSRDLPAEGAPVTLLAEPGTLHAFRDGRRL